MAKKQILNHYLGTLGDFFFWLSATWIILTIATIKIAAIANILGT